MLSLDDEDGESDEDDDDSLAEEEPVEGEPSEMTSTESAIESPSDLGRLERRLARSGTGAMESSDWGAEAKRDFFACTADRDVEALDVDDEGVLADGRESDDREGARRSTGACTGLGRSSGRKLSSDDGVAALACGTFFLDFFGLAAGDSLA